jgi:hypothetical protein
MSWGRRVSLAGVRAHLWSGSLPAATPVFSSASKSGPHVRERSRVASFQPNFLQNHRRAIAYHQVEFRLLSVSAYCRRSGDHGLIEGYSNIRTTATLFPIICMGNQPPTSSFISGFARLAVTVHLLSGIQRVGRCDPTRLGKNTYFSGIDTYRCQNRKVSIVSIAVSIPRT